MTISRYKLNLSDISKNISKIYNITHPVTYGPMPNGMYFYLTDEKYRYLIIILIY